MDLYHKTILLLTFLFLFPILVFAQSQDYLSITGNLSSGQISIDVIEQRIFESSDVAIYKSGSYEARLFKGDRLVSNNFFEILENSELWVDAEGDKPEEQFVSQTSTFNVKLPLNDKVSIDDSRVEIWKGSQMLLSQKLSEAPLDVVTAQDYPISKTESEDKNLPVYGIIAAGLVVAGWLIWKWLKTRANQVNTGVSQ